MDFYPRYPGDYMIATLELNMMEDGAYSRMLDYYYSTEKPLEKSKKLYQIVRAHSRAERKAVDTVLTRFFTESDGFYYHKRADEEIEKYTKRLKTNKENGKKGGRPPKPNNNPTDNPTVNPKITEGVTQTEPIQEQEQEPYKHKDKNLSSKNKFSDRDLACAENIYQRVLVVAPLTPEPNFKKWADTIRLMREQDKLTHEKIWAVFTWANQDNFWRTNIRGPDKLRKQFAQLDAKMNSVPTSQTRQQQIQEKSFDAIDAWEPDDAIQ